MTDTVDLSFLSDGTYGRELGRISPEGNMYGQIRVIRDVISSWWWNGTKWLMITDDIGQSESFNLLPTSGQHDEIWRCKGALEGTKQWWRYFRWDAQSQSWIELELFWTVESKSDLPSNTYKIGQCHQVKEPEVLAVWDGYSWRRLKVGSFEDDIGLLSSLETLEAGSDSIRSDFNELLSDFGEFQQETEQIYNGFIRGFTPEIELIYVSENELSIRPRYNDYDYLVVNEQNIKASKRTSVFTTTPVLNWNSETESLYYSTLQPSTTYWIYWANRSEGFNISVYDYRGKLFCSTTEPSSNYLGESGLGLDAILIGRCNTNASTKFLYELDVSLVSRMADLTETFREFSDFDLVYVDETTIQLKRNHGSYGQIYIPESLYYLGENREVYTTSPRIIFNEDDSTIDYDDSAILPNYLYYCYLGGDTDTLNFNDINPNTNIPWHPEDVGSTGNYDADKDFRLYLFLSAKAPIEGRMSSTWLGYWTRHVGQVSTDGSGKFVYNSGLSAIKQATLQPRFFDGLAEISIITLSGSSFKVIRKRGTSGICMVGSEAIQLYDDDNPLSSTFLKTVLDTVYAFDNENLSSPLSTTGKTVQDYIGQRVYFYLANSRSCWGPLANTIFASDHAPTNAYLGSDYPGNNARWILTIDPPVGQRGSQLVTNGYFTTDFTGWDGGGKWSRDGAAKSVLYDHDTVMEANATTTSNVDSSEWITIPATLVTQSTPGEVIASAIYHVASFDEKATWKVFKSDAWTPIARNNNGTWQYSNAGSWTDASSNTQAQALIQATDQPAYQWVKSAIDSMTSEDWFATGGFSGNIDWAIRLVNGTGYVVNGSTNTSEDYATADMSADNAPSPNVVSASTNNTYVPYYAFDQDPSVPWQATTSTGWLKYDFGSGNGKCINKFRYSGYSTVSPKRWKLEGSNNNSTWITLYDHTGSDSPDTDTWTSYFTFSNSTAYRYYRINVTSSWGSNVTIREVHLVEAQTETKVPSFTRITFSYTTDTIKALMLTGSPAISGKTYEIKFSASDVAHGAITPSIGGTDGEPSSMSASVTQLIQASTTDTLKLIPTSDFNGRVDNVSCMPIETSILSGSYIKDSIASDNLIVDNDSVGAMILWDSQKIMSVINATLAASNASSVFDAQKNSGLNVKLEYANSTTLRLRSVSGQDETIVFGDLLSMTIPEEGVTLSLASGISPIYFSNGTTNTCSLSCLPVMTSNTAPSPYTITATGYYTGYAPWKAFDGISSTQWIQSGPAVTEANPACIMVDFGSGKAINRYQIIGTGGASNYPPLAWKLQATNNVNAAVDDDETENGWATLHVGTILDGVYNRYYGFTNGTEYQKYRIRVTGTAVGDVVTITEIVLVEAELNETYTRYNVYAQFSEDPSTVLYVSHDEPDRLYPKLKTLGENSILVGYVGLSNINVLYGPQSVYSEWNQETLRWSMPCPLVNTTAYYFSGERKYYISPTNYMEFIPGLLIPWAGAGSISRSASTIASNSQVYNATTIGDNTVTVSDGTYHYKIRINADILRYADGILSVAGVYSLRELSFSIYISAWQEYPLNTFFSNNVFTVLSGADSLVVTRLGNV